MKTLALRSIPKRNLSRWPKAEASPLQRLCSFLLRDLLPCLVMVIILAVFASLVGHQIDQSKSSRMDRMVEVSAHP